MFGRVEQVEGLNKLMKDISKLDKIPQKQITKGVRRGTNIILKEARLRASERHITGKMSRKLTLKAERSKKRGKKVMQVTYQKVDKYPEAVKITKDGTRYYYPSSQNFGFKTRDGEKVEGLHFLEGAMQSKSGEAARVIVDEIGKEIEKSLQDGSIKWHLRVY